MAAEIDAEPLPRRTARPARAAAPRARSRRPTSSAARINPVALAGNGVVRGGAARRCASSPARPGIPVAETFMGKGLLDRRRPKALGAVGLQAGDYAMAGFDEADVVIAVGYDLVEHSPEHWNPNRDKRIVCIDSGPGRDRRVLHHPRSSWSATSTTSSRRLAEECRPRAPQGGSPRLRDVVQGRFEAAQGRRRTSRCSRRARCTRSARRSAARTSSSPTSACTSSGSGGCSRPTSRTRC